MIRFAYNPTSWGNGPIPGGMADRLIRPILPHLESEYELVDKPQPNGVNVYYTFPSTYGIQTQPPKETAVFVSHGIADKAWRNTPKIRGRFAWVFVSGPAWTRRMVLDGFDPRRIIEAGYTKLDPIFNGEVDSPWPDRDGRIRVLWAPSHGGGGERHARSQTPPSDGPRRTSHWDREQILGQLPCDQFDIKVALHPRHRPDKTATLDEYVGADVVIADGGSTIYEAWALELPVVFPTWLTGAANLAKSTPSNPTLEGSIYKRQLGYHALSPDELAAQVRRAADCGIGVAERQFIEDIIPTAYRGVSGRMHAEALDDIANGVKPRHVPKVPMVEFAHYQTDQVRAVPEGSVQERRLEQSSRWRRKS